MKKTYITPQTHIICMETESIICESITMQIGKYSDVQDEQPVEEDGYWIAE